MHRDKRFKHFRKSQHEEKIKSWTLTTTQITDAAKAIAEREETDIDLDFINARLLARAERVTERTDASLSSFLLLPHHTVFPFALNFEKQGIDRCWPLLRYLSDQRPDHRRTTN